MQSFVVYSPDNKNIADNIEANLRQTGVKVVHDTRRLSERMDEYKMLSNHPSDPIILVVSDNFLKDKACMYESLNFLQNPTLKNRVFPVITDGKATDSQAEATYSPTKFERVSNVIHYMNYWQDQYLELRKQKRDNQINNEEEFNKELQIIRAISSEIGEFLRILRSTSYMEYPVLHEKKFEPFFKKAGWSHLSGGSWRPIPLLLEENLLPTEIDVNDIPGINMVMDKASNVQIPVPEIETPSPPPVKEVSSISDILQEQTIEKIIKEEVEDIAENKLEGADLLEKISNYVEPEIEEVPEIKIEESNEASIPEEETSLLEKNAPNKDELSYQDKSSYELLVSLFDDDNLLDELEEEVALGKKVEAEKEAAEIEKIETAIKEELDNIIKKSEISEENIIPQDNVQISSDEIEEIKEKIEEIKSEVEAESSAPSMEEILEALAADEPVDAMKMLQAKLHAEPLNVEARYEYAMLLSDYIRNYSEAKDEFRAVIEIDGKNIDSYLRLAEIYMIEEDYINVKHCYERAILINPAYPGLQYKYACLLNEGFKAHKKQALKHFKEAVSQDPQNIDAIYQLAVMQYEYAGKPKKALKKFQKVIAMEPEHTFANYDIAVLYYELNKPKLAAQYYRDAYTNNPELRTEKNDEAFKVNQYLFSTQEVLPEIEEVLEEIEVEDISELTGTYEISIKESTGIVEGIKEEDSVNYKKIEELLEEEESFENLEDEVFENESILSGKEEVIVEDFIDELENEAEKDALEEITEEVVVPIIEEKTNTATKALTLVTGATSGIGNATAHHFASQGHPLIITGRRVARLEVLKAELIDAHGIDVEILEFDVRNLDACRKAMDSLDERFKNVDILINNAGLARGKALIHEGDIDHWETMIDTNIKGLLYMTRLVAPGMVSRGKGHIINIGSIAGKEVYPDGNVYCATKHAVDALTKSMRIDLHKYGIRVGAIHPGAVEETEFSMVRHDHNPEKARNYQDFTPVNARDIAEIIHFVTTRPPHVNIQDLLVMGTQQATATITDNTGRKFEG